MRVAWPREEKLSDPPPQQAAKGSTNLGLEIESCSLQNNSNRIVPPEHRLRRRRAWSGDRHLGSTRRRVRSNRQHLPHFQTSHARSVWCPPSTLPPEPSGAATVLGHSAWSDFFTRGVVAATSRCRNIGRFTTCVRHGKTVVPLRLSRSQIRYIKG